MTAGQTFRLGVNYWPARFAMGFWRNWNEEALARDFARIRLAGLDSVRLFLTWEDYQPTAHMVDAKVLERLKRTLDRASAAGLMVMPTLFTGHMSGANWLPAWAVRRTTSAQRFPVVCGGRVVPGAPGNWYTDSNLRDAQTRLASQCASAVSRHPALLAWDLGNENSNCVIPGSRESARSWLETITNALRREDAQTPITVGLHMEDLQEDRLITPKDVADYCEFLTMHGYPGYASFTDGPTDERLLPFLVQLTRFLGEGKEVLFSEFGVPTQRHSHIEQENSNPKNGPQLVSESDASSYVHRGLRALQQSGASGAMLWCYSDYSPRLFAAPPFVHAPHERSFGLFRCDGSAKPAVAEMVSFSERRPMMAIEPRLQNSDFIDLTIDDYYDCPGRHLPRLFGKYCAALGESSPFSG